MHSENHYRILNEYTNVKNEYGVADLPVKYLFKEQNLKVEEKGSKIIEFYKQKCVFITGGTGFLGKLLIEKLLRACTDIDTLFILVRAKKGKNTENRLEELLNDEIFSNLRKLQPDFHHKVVGINGDISLPQLGISPENRKELMEKVNVIFHGAATVRFDEKIRLAFKSNVLGTKEIIALGQDCKKLEVYVHVSTAYSNCIHQDIDEVFYEPQIDLNTMLELLDKHSDTELEEMTPKILGKYPNSYTFTKNLTEHLIKETVNFPYCVFRPSIVTSTYQEPLKGWVDNMYGPVGIICGVSTCVIHSMWCDVSKRVDIVPADYVINSMIAIGYKTAKEKSLSKIYNYSSIENRVTFENYFAKLEAFGKFIPSIHIIGFFYFVQTKYNFLHTFYAFIFNLIPAFFMDCAAKVLGKKPRMMQLYKMLHNHIQVLGFFTNNEWNIKNNNTQELWNNLTPADKKAFPFDMKDLIWDIYYCVIMAGGRKYILKDDYSTLDKAREKFAFLNSSQKILMYIFKFLIFMLIYKIMAVFF